MSLMEIENKLIQLSKELATEHEKHKRTVEVLEADIEETRRQKGIYMKGIDLEKIKAAEAVLKVRGFKEEFDSECTRRAIYAIATKSEHIKTHYFGAKDYAHWTHQQESHPYGYGPKHGTIVFSIGLKNPGHQLTDDEIECCLYYLNVIMEPKGREAIAGKTGYAMTGICEE